MKTDYMLIGIVLAAFVYLIGFPVFATYSAGFIILMWAFSKMTAPKKSKKDENILDPIILQSTRGAPYRIPSKMTLKFKDKASYDSPAYAEAQTGGILGTIGKYIGKSLRKISGDD